MPEIGEVEVVRRVLHERLQGLTLAAVRVGDVRLADFAFACLPLTGRQLTDTLRHGKLIALCFEDELIVCHLRMTGALTFRPRAHTRAVLSFAPAPVELCFSDPRRFGTLTVTSREAFAAGQGPDVLDEPDALAGVYPKLARTARPLKAVLLDQQLISGLGNWMADELCFAQKLHPAVATRELPAEQWAELMSRAHALAARSVEMGGVSVRDYVHPDGGRGRMQDELVCYGRRGQPCVRCGTALEHLRVAGRGSTICPRCQPPSG